MHQLQVIIILSTFAVSLIIEALLSFRDEKHLYEKKGALTSVYIGLLYVASNVGAKLLLLLVFEAVYRYRLFTIDNGWKACILLFLLNDICYYFFHRAEHRINWFWASHMVHHSSAQFNILSAVRMPWTGQISGQFLFWCWLPLLGFDPTMIIFVYNIGLIFQVWLHTETIKKLPRVIEFVFNTPSHHRVHHGCDLKYMDKNLGCVLIVWDRLFHTFQEEEETPTYGLQEPLSSDNPFVITTIAWRQTFGKISRAGSVKNALNYIIQPPGWSHDGSSKTIDQMLKEDRFNARLTTY